MEDAKANVITFRNLYEAMTEDLKWAEEQGLMDELMSQEIQIDIVDFEGNITNGKGTLVAGWLATNGYLITGNLIGITDSNERL